MLADLARVMDLLNTLDEHLIALVATYGEWSYGILFLVIFCETGLVVTPFLPGDSLLFAAGAVAAVGSLDLASLCALLAIAAITGDAANYAVGRAVTDRWVHRSRLIKRHHVERAEIFYARHGGKAIVLARFAPFLRTFVPFVAGAARMPYARFALYNVAGGVVWVVACCSGGYLFGRVPFVERNFTLVMIAIVILSISPVVLGPSIRRGRSDGEGVVAPKKGLR